jgi:hypothetical protein
MTKCVYCTCTAQIEPGKGYCSACGHDAVAHVAAAAGTPLGLKLVIAAAALAAVYFFMNMPSDDASKVPGAAGLQTPPPAVAPADTSGSVPAAPTVYTLPPPTVQPNGQVLPAAPPLGDWRSHPGAAVPDSATPNPRTSSNPR